MEKDMKSSEIQIVEKPEWVSWEDIHDVLWQAHAENRKNGILMSYPTLPEDVIKEKIGDGKLLVALDNDRLVGTAALKTKQTTLWFGQHQFGYCCFASVLPEYNGLGIYKRMCEEREKMARNMGIELMLFDTHERNERVISINQMSGYKKVDMRFYKDHYNVVMVKWLNGCPYSDYQCKIRFMLRKIRLKVCKLFV